MMPRRGMYSTSNMSIIDGLEAISKPVMLDNAGGSMGLFHANPTKTDHKAECIENDNDHNGGKGKGWRKNLWKSLKSGMGLMLA
ncbi:hypothetical protein Hanom_Chr11g01031341 [Helianthus anomalus]